jgi:hypothetical protein
MVTSGRRGSQYAGNSGSRKAVAEDGQIAWLFPACSPSCSPTGFPARCAAGKPDTGYGTESPIALPCWPGIPTQTAISTGVTCLTPRRPRQTSGRQLPRRQAAPGIRHPEWPTHSPAGTRRSPGRRTAVPCYLGSMRIKRNHSGKPGPSVPCPPRTIMSARDRRSAPVLRTCRIECVTGAHIYAPTAVLTHDSANAPHLRSHCRAALLRIRKEHPCRIWKVACCTVRICGSGSNLGDSCNDCIEITICLVRVV